MNRSGVEFIGFLISLIALIFLFFKNKNERQADSSDLRTEREFDGESDEAYDDPVTQFLKNLEKEMEETKKNSPPELPKKHSSKPPEMKPIEARIQSVPAYNKQPPKQSKQDSLSQLEGYRLKSSIESRKLKSDIEARRLKTSVENRHLKTSIRRMSQLPEEPERDTTSRAAKMLTKLPELSDIIVYDTILNKPKGW